MRGAGKSRLIKCAKVWVIPHILTTTYWHNFAPCIQQDCPEVSTPLSASMLYSRTPYMRFAVDLPQIRIGIVRHLRFNLTLRLNCKAGDTFKLLKKLTLSTLTDSGVEHARWSGPCQLFSPLVCIPCSVSQNQFVNDKRLITHLLIVSFLLFSIFLEWFMFTSCNFFCHVI